MTIPKKYLNNSVDIYHVTINSTGRTVDSIDYEEPCRIQKDAVVFRDENGVHTAVKTKIYFHPDTTISVKDEIYIGSRKYVIDDILESVNAFGTLHHYEVFLA